MPSLASRAIPLVREGAVSSPAELQTLLGVPYESARQAYYNARRVAGLAKPHGRRVLTVLRPLGDGTSYFEPGRGNRDDACARYEACLFAWGGGNYARCPSACAHRTERDHARDRAIAMLPRERREDV